MFATVDCPRQSQVMSGGCRCEVYQLQQAGCLAHHPPRSTCRPVISPRDVTLAATSGRGPATSFSAINTFVVFFEIRTVGQAMLVLLGARA